MRVDEIGLDHQQADEMALRVDFQSVSNAQYDAGDVVMQQFKRPYTERNREQRLCQLEEADQQQAALVLGVRTPP